MEPSTSSDPPNNHVEEPNHTKFEQVKGKTSRLFLYWPFDYYLVSFLARILPPYTRLAVYFFCGLELIWNTFVMILNQKFYDYSTRIFPVAYSMFIYTEARDKNDTFSWTREDLDELNNYQHKLLYMWFVTTIIVIYCSLCIIFQFFTVETNKGKKTTMCLKKPMFGYIMTPILLILMGVELALLLCQYSTYGEYYKTFQDLFFHALHEEKFLSKIEYNLDCILDEDEEKVGAWYCSTAIQKSIMSPDWTKWLLRVYIIWHVVMGILAIFFNKKIYIFKKSSKEEERLISSPDTLEEGPPEPVLEKNGIVVTK